MLDGFGHNVVIEGVARALLDGVEAPVGFADGLDFHSDVTVSAADRNATGIETRSKRKT